ncbi:MAG: hypothetical protein WB992_08590 [Bryobacteraceae bacterium]
MNWSHIAQAGNAALAILLIIRLLMLRLHSVYRVFCAFLLFDLLASLITLVERLLHDPRIDYRITWIGLEFISWILSLWIVYALLDAILANLPGILRFSRKLLNATFLAALIVAVLTAKPEYAAWAVPGHADSIYAVVSVVLVLERVISSVALLVLVSMLSFILWFPVQMPRNLAVFSVGFIVYFAAITALLLAQSVWSHEISRAISNAIVMVPTACYAYWAIFITAEGERRSVRIGHGWHTGDQKRLIGQLEAMNVALLRAARR